jgi:hypothetical protein
MRQASLGLCAVGGLLVVLAGCANNDFAGLFLLKSQGPGGDRVVAGSLETVAHSTQTSLRQLGLAAELSRQGEAFHVSSVTSGGARFALVLTRERSAQGTEQTRIRLEWLDNRDERGGAQILARIDAETKK